MKTFNCVRMLAGTAGLVAGMVLALSVPAFAQDGSPADDDPLRDRQLTIDCADINNTDTCEFSGDVIVSERIANFTSGLIEALSSNDSSICDVTGNEASCDLPQENGQDLTVNCTIDDMPGGSLVRSAECTLEELPAAYFDLDCGQTGSDSGFCTVTTMPSAIAEDIAQLLPGMNPQSISVGVNLLTSCALGGGTAAFQRDCDAVVQALVSGNDVLVQRTLEEITPLNTDNTVDNSRYGAGTRIGHAQDRMARVRAGAAGLDVASLQFFDGQQWLQTGDLLAQNGGSGSDAASGNASDYGRLGVFIDGSLITSEQDTTGIEEESETDVQALTFGVDYRFTDNFVAGVALGFGLSQTDYGANRGELDSLGLSLIGYGSYFRDDFYIEGALSIGG
ncbi:MAG: autotransporter outer membrane beta-barrel domain-containing protein, partial [Thiohalobacterales bacterium]|nr:autotransporter outer membrane beta-barrel domain-containing protein [Thiohalobacterales bacterium]